MRFCAFGLDSNNHEMPAYDAFLMLRVRRLTPTATGW